MAETIAYQCKTHGSACDFMRAVEAQRIPVGLPIKKGSHYIVLVFRKDSAVVDDIYALKDW